MDSFGRTEQFFIKLSDIEELQLRIELWQFCFVFLKVIIDDR